MRPSANYSLLQPEPHNLLVPGRSTERQRVAGSVVARPTKGVFETGSGRGSAPRIDDAATDDRRIAKKPPESPAIDNGLSVASDIPADGIESPSSSPTPQWPAAQSAMPELGIAAAVAGADHEEGKKTAAENQGRQEAPGLEQAFSASSGDASVGQVDGLDVQTSAVCWPPKATGPERFPREDRQEGCEPEIAKIAAAAQTIDLDSFECRGEREIITRPASAPVAISVEPTDGAVDLARGVEFSSDALAHDPRPGAGPPENTFPETPAILPKYRPNLGGRLLKASPRSQRNSPGGLATPAAASALEAELLLSFRPGGWGIELSLLLRREEAMPEALTVTLAEETVDLFAIDDSLFEPVKLTDPVIALSNGIVAETAEMPTRRWARSGRRLHVFTERAGVLGFSSAPRVLIGQENVILSNADLANQVVECCGAAGSDQPDEVHGPGIPEGWRCFRGFRPRHPGRSNGLDDIFLALSPLPHAAIEFVGGMTLRRGAWLDIRPPAIRILGGDPAEGEVTVDGAFATRRSVDQWVAPGWDRPGSHVVRYAGHSRTYEISETEEEWPPWDAHAGPGYSMVGAIAAGANGRPFVVLPGSACWLLGARPGEIARAIALPGGFSAGASPNFTPIWAIASKEGRRRQPPRLVGPLDAPGAKTSDAAPEAVSAWRQLVRGASCVPVAQGAEKSALVLWEQYIQAARALRKRTR